MSSRLQLALGFFCLALSAQVSYTQGWQSAISAEVVLGVRDKNGTSPLYTVVFSVTEPPGGIVSTTIKGKGSEFPSSRFPADFNTYFKPGKYSWRATVGGKEVASGRFAYESVGTGERVTTSTY